MDWQNNAFDWNRARAFLVTAQTGSLSAAARALGVTQPTVGRQVTALETELGVVLFERVGYSLVLTPTGLALMEHVQAMAEAANAVALVAGGQSQSIEGSVCISASEVYAVFFLPPIIAKLRRLQPKIHIELVATSAVSDLRRREADIALRNFRPTQAQLITKKVKDDVAHLYATPEYVASLGNPNQASDLNAANFVSFDGSGMLLDGLNDMGMALSKNNFPVISENYLTHWQLVKQGLGIGIMPEAIGDAEAQVIRVIPAMEPIRFPVWLTTHRELNTSRRVRMVFDLLAQELANGVPISLA